MDGGQLHAWLEAVGFSLGNPFDNQDACEYDTDLETCFVKPAAYTTLLAGNLKTSCIVYAPRGAGKTTLRLMYVEHLRKQPQRQALVVQLVDWHDVAQAVGSDPTAVDLRRHLLPALWPAVLCAMLDTPMERPRPITDVHLQHHLSWLYRRYQAQLTPWQQQRFAENGWVYWQPYQNLDGYALDGLPAHTQLRLLTTLVQTLGFGSCVIIVDRIDETRLTENDPAAAAALIRELLSVFRTAHMSFKCFLPAAVFDVLQAQQALRTDLIPCLGVTWSEAELQHMLEMRLRHYSAHEVPQLAQLAEPGFRDIDEQLCRLANGSPRLLMALGEAIVQVCANGLSNSNAVLRREDLAAAVEQLRSRAAHFAELLTPVEPAPAPAPQPPTPFPTLRPPLVTPASNTVPRLRLKDNFIYRGNERLSLRLRPLQSDLFNYFYINRGINLSAEQIIHAVWIDKGRKMVEDPALRGMISRLRELIEPDPDNAVYLVHNGGNYYSLENAGD